MSIEPRLRTGLTANTEHLQPNLDHELSTLLRRAHRRLKVRTAAVGLLAAAVVAAVVWLSGARGVDLGLDRPDPAKSPPPASSTPFTKGPIPIAGRVGTLDPGPYAMIMIGDGDDSLPRAAVDVPEGGYSTNGGYVIDTRTAKGEPVQRGILSFWLVDEVTTDPCKADSYVDPGPSVRDLATALAAQPGRTATDPAPVTLGGHRGLYVELTVPEDSDVRGCTDRQLTFGRSNDPYYLASSIPGAVDRLWILQVRGIRMVAVVTTTPDDTQDTIADLVGIAESTTIINPANPQS